MVVASADGKPRVTRLLTAGAKGADRMAHASGMSQAFDEAVEEAIVRALRSPAITRAIERATADHPLAAELDTDQVVLLVNRVLESELAADTWAQILASEQAQMLVERIARAPEVRAAIASQSAGFIGDIGIRLTKLTESLDDALERVFRRSDPDSETDQAGLATRLVAGAVDLGLLAIAYSLASSALASVFTFVFGSHLSLTGGIILISVGVIAAGAAFVAFWALAGRTPGMHFMAIRLMQNGSREVSLRCALKRAFALLLSVLPLGLGYLAILRDRERRAWHDRIAGTEVVYDMSRRTAPYAVYSRSPDATSGPTPGAVPPATPSAEQPRGAP